MDDEPASARRAGRAVRQLAASAVHALRETERGVLVRRAVRSLAVALSADGAELVCMDTHAAHRLAAFGLGGEGLGACEAPQARYVARHGAPVVVEDYAAERRFLLSPRWRERGVASAVSVPFGSDGADEHFVLTAFSQRASAFGAREVGLVAAYARILAAAFAQSRRSRDDSARLLESFAAVLAHEVRNPLNALALNAEVASMLLGSDRGSDVPKVLERVGRDVQRCGQAIRELSAVVARDVPEEGYALDDLLDTIADRLRQGLGTQAIDVELGPVDERLAYAGNRTAIEFALAQMARTVIGRGVRGVRIGVEREREGYAIEIERLPIADDTQSGEATLSPTRIAAYALARHALEKTGARLEPEALGDSVPQRCRVSFPMPAIRTGFGA